MRSTRTNLIHSLKTHCFDCVKQSYKLRAIFYLREFCSLDTSSIEFLMSRSNRCHKNVWIYYYYYQTFDQMFYQILYWAFYWAFHWVSNYEHITWIKQCFKQCFHHNLKTVLLFLWLVIFAFSWRSTLKDSEDSEYLLLFTSFFLHNSTF